jgi:hypothetical protein
VRPASGPSHIAMAGSIDLDHYLYGAPRHSREEVQLLFDPNNISNLHGLQCVQSPRDKRLQTHIAVSLRSKNQNGNIQTGNVLLIRNVAVNGDQHFVGTGCSFQKIAIFQSFDPASSMVWTSWPAKSRLRWRVTHSSSSNFTFEQPFLREL